MMQREGTDLTLSEVTTFRVGGRPVHYVRPAGEQELSGAIAFFRARQLPFYVLGGGSNLLVDDGELPFAVVHICDPGFNWVEERENGRLRVGAGVPLSRLLTRCRDAGLGGLEYLTGIPGTVGGAVTGNAGAWGRSISEQLRRIRFFDRNGRMHETEARHEAFSYRNSSLRGRVITEVELALEPGAPGFIAERMKRFVQLKRRRQPMKLLSAGCVFKNPPNGSAGRLLDSCGLKGQRVGGAIVSWVHANFIVNRGGATARDVVALIEKMRAAVLGRFGVELELEIRHWCAERKVA